MDQPEYLKEMDNNQIDRDNINITGQETDAFDNRCEENNSEMLGKQLADFTSPLWAKIGGALTIETLSLLSADETTLLAYEILRNELLEGGFVQLIQNGYGPFIFLNPFARAIRLWGENLSNMDGNHSSASGSEDNSDIITLKEFSKWLYKARKVYDKTRSLLETPTNDEDEFMALYEQAEDWDVFDDDFVETEPAITTQIIRAYKNRLDKADA